MKLTYSYIIPYKDVDMHRRLRLYDLENYLLTTAAQAADQLGFGIPHLLPYGYTWIITHLNAEVYELPTHGDNLTIETWIESNAHSLSKRNFRLYLNTESGQRLIGRANSVWAVLDLQKREIVNAFNLPMFDGSVDGEVLDMPRMQRLRSIEHPTAETDHIVTYSDMDYNGHCNSCKYIEAMLNIYYPEFIANRHKENKNAPLRIEITYSKELYLGEVLHLRYEVKDGEVCYHGQTSDGTTSCTCRISQLSTYGNE